MNCATHHTECVKLENGLTKTKMSCAGLRTEFVKLEDADELAVHHTEFVKLAKQF